MGEGIGESGGVFVVLSLLEESCGLSVSIWVFLAGAGWFALALAFWVEVKALMPEKRSPLKEAGISIAYGNGCLCVCLLGGFK